MTQVNHNSPYILTIDVNHAGQRLDNFLINHLKGVPKGHIYRIVRKGEVRINKKRSKAYTRIELNDEIRIPPIRVAQQDTKIPSLKSQEKLLATILFEDKNLIVMNKPAGWPVHSGTKNDFGVIEVLKSAKARPPFLELVHRLDKETSGCLMLAKSRLALTTMQQVLREHGDELTKSYVSLVKGKWQHGNNTVNYALSKSLNNAGSKFSQINEQGKHAITEFSPTKFFADTTLMHVVISTGRMHQIRAHAQYLNHPVVGDRKYGDFEFNRKIKKQHGLNRMFLHASNVKFKHPITNKQMSIDAPLPDELNQVLDKLEEVILRLIN